MQACEKKFLHNEDNFPSIYKIVNEFSYLDNQNILNRYLLKETGVTGKRR